MIRFQVIIRGYNCKKYLADCLESLIAQVYTNWKATLILDHPKDGSVKVAYKYASKDPRITLYVNKKRKGLACNMWRGMKYAKADDEDVFAWLDADDELPKLALKMVAHEYEKREELLVTHGSYKHLGKRGRTRMSRAYRKGTPIREQKWRGSHLKTFKAKMFKHFKKRYLKDKNKKWYMASSDVALMIPILEMAGLKRIKFIKKITYKWRPTPDTIYKDKEGKALQLKNKKEILKKKPLKRVVF
jgi:cellulose synthase/poly-beta-1,6-N-acetylglucosamine synthase-like glycosyltransferase